MSSDKMELAADDEEVPDWAKADQKKQKKAKKQKKNQKVAAAPASPGSDVASEAAMVTAVASGHNLKGFVKTKKSP